MRAAQPCWLAVPALGLATIAGGVGANAVVYDLGAGTCDLTLLRRAPHGFDVVATDGLNDVVRRHGGQAVAWAFAEPGGPHREAFLRDHQTVIVPTGSTEQPASARKAGTTAGEAAPTNSVVLPSFAGTAASAAMRPLIAAEPMLRAPRPEIVPELNGASAA